MTITTGPYTQWWARFFVNVYPGTRIWTTMTTRWDISTPAWRHRVLARTMLEDWETEPAVYDDDQSETAPNCHPRRNRERFSTPHTARDPDKIQEVELESEDLQGIIRQPPKVGAIRFHHEPESSNTSHADVIPGHHFSHYL